MDRLAETTPANAQERSVVRAPRPIYEHRAAFDLVELHESPEAAVIAAVAVVAHHEEFAGRHRHRAEIVARRVERAVAGGNLEMRVRIGHRLAVQEHLAIFHLHRVARNSDDAFDEVFALVLWKNEYHHVAAMDGGKMHNVTPV